MKNYLFSLALFLAGFAFLVHDASPGAALGVFLVMWANNITTSTRVKELLK